MTTSPLLGQINMFPYTFAPSGWAYCDGQLLPISNNPALFSLIGTIFGGDGSTTFALPDLRGRVAIHAGQGAGLTNRTFGGKSGAETTTLSESNLPAHSHALKASSDAGATPAPSGKTLADAGFFDNEFNDGTNLVDLKSTSIGDTGSGTAFDHMPPFLVIRFCIALVGTYPSP